MKFNQLFAGEVMQQARQIRDYGVMSMLEPADSGPPDLLLEAAEKHLGVTYLYPYQRLVVANTIDAVQTKSTELENQIVVLPTGSGKTLCFSLPAWILAGTTVVIYPLLALMKDQARRAAQAGMSVVVLRGGQAQQEREQLTEQISRQQVQLVITNPETLRSPDVEQALSSARVDHLVIDEAHCVSEWGESFRPAYLELRSSIKAISPMVTTAFTATASDPVLRSLQRHLFGNAPVRLIRADPDRPNIAYSVIAAFSKKRVLASLLTHPSLQRPAIVFTRSRSLTEEIARSLGSVVDSDVLAAYHAGLTSQTREAIEQWFFSSDSGILVTTCAYGMGVDKANVRTVIHYEPPSSVEAFLQESGRAGRDRAAAESILLASPTDYQAAGANPRYDQILMYAQTRGCRRRFLMRVMAAESESCFGCDYCTPEAVPGAIRASSTDDQEAARVLLETIRRHPNRFSAEDLITSAHDAAATRELVGALLDQSIIKTRRHRPWRGKLSIP